jgi:S-DNA-T family DNA segregation ATPase FtsK/SpoIIIE
MTPEQEQVRKQFDRKLKGLGIEGIVMNVIDGPIVSVYQVLLTNDTPLSKILNKAEDFAMACGCEKVMIQREGHFVSIYAANKERRDVDFKLTLDWIMRDENARKAIVPIPLGVDFMGKPAFIELVSCPHILIAGSTGSGKTVFETAIISILQVARSPREITLHIVDTKRNLPLLSELPIVDRTCTTVKEYLEMMVEVIKIHERRTDKLYSARVRDVTEYNTFVGPENALPRIVIVIDEFGDLILQDREMRRDRESPLREYPKADFLLQRICQVGRSTGIHVVAATQRTSVKVISGDIKTNFPTRISLRLPTAADSITILGSGGAENLLGQGDLLLQSPASEEVKRFHGPHVKHEDIARVVAQYQEIKDTYRHLVGDTL